jgi:hypothetical protein
LNKQYNNYVRLETIGEFIRKIEYLQTIAGVLMEELAVKENEEEISEYLAKYIFFYGSPS